MTEVLHRDSECVVIRASILDIEGRLRATGHSEEYRKTTQINKTSALENAETSAIGRALAGLGIGGTEFASANEVQNAIHQQQKGKPTEGAGENLTEAQRVKVEGVVEAMKEHILNDLWTTAVKEYKGAGLDADEMVYLWTHFPASGDRRKLKEANEALKEAA